MRRRRAERLLSVRGATDAPSGRIAIYYGCADTVTGLCFCQVDEVIDFIKANSACKLVRINTD